MPRFSAKQRKMRGGGKSGPGFIQLFHYVKRSLAYHGLSPIARAIVVELLDRYNGCNNGMIVFGVREAAYEIGRSTGAISKAMTEVDDSGLARPTKVGEWRGRQATEWRLMWKRCDKTGDLPQKQWTLRTPYSEVPKRQPRREPLSNAERCRRYRERHRHNGSDTKSDTMSSPGETQKFTM
jgi:hypothetical protein